MSSFGRYTPRRRRGDEEQHEGGGLPVIPLMIIVVFAGLLLGGLLAHFFGSRGSVSQTAMNPPPVTPIPSATPMPPITPRPRPSRTPRPRASATMRPSSKPAKRVAKAAPSPTATATASSPASPQPTPTAVALKPQTPQPALTARPVVVPTTTARATLQPLAKPVLRTLPPVVTESPRTPKPRRQVSRIVALRVPRTPDGVVRAYLSALAAGRQTTATTYLASGSPTEASFMRGARITDIRSTSNGDGTYNVTADVIARGGRYRIIATVAALPYGMLITDHFSIKPP